MIHHLALNGMEMIIIVHMMLYLLFCSTYGQQTQKNGKKEFQHSNLYLSTLRDGKVRFGLVLQGIFENPELDYWFSPQIIVNLGPDHRFGPKRSGSGSQEVRTTNRT